MIFRNFFYLVSLSLALFACQSSSEPPLEDPNFNTRPERDELLLQVFLVSDIWQNTPEERDGLLYAELGEIDSNGELVGDRGRLSEILSSDSMGYSWKFLVGDQSFVLQYSDSTKKMRLVPAATVGTILDDFAVPGSSFQLISNESFDSLFDQSIRLLSEGEENTDLLVEDDQILESPQSLSYMDSSVQVIREIHSCDTEELRWFGSEPDSRVQLQFFDSFFQPGQIVSEAFQVLDTGSTQLPLLPGVSGAPLLFEQLFPGEEPSENSIVRSFDRSALRKRVYSGLRLKGFESVGLRVEVFVEEIARYDLIYEACSAP